MKKYIFILILCLLTTGCFGKTASGNLETTCTKEEDTYGLIEKTTYTFEYYKGTITKVILTKEYSGEDMTRSIDTYRLAYSTYNGITIDTSYNKITYTFDVNTISEDTKKVFNIKNTYNDEIKALNDYNCK